MAQQHERTCPACSEERTFRRVASTTLHLGEKRKWRDDECGYQFVTIDGIDQTEHRED
jgi:hypothetical protein